MRQWQQKSDNTAPNSTGILSAAEDDARGNELANAVLSAGISLDAFDVLTDTDLTMVGQAMARYASGGVFYRDTGAANTYVLSTPLAFTSPKALFKGMQAIWVPANTCTGASTANVAALGSKAICRPDGSALQAGDIGANIPMEMFYDPTVGSGSWLIKPWTFRRGDFATDTGTANAVVADLDVAPATYKKGLYAFIKKVAAANTGNVTVNLNGLGAVSLLDPTGAQIASGNLPGSVVMFIVFDGTAFRLLNAQITATTVGSITASSGEGITVGGSTPYPVALAFASLSADTPASGSLFAFYKGSHHKIIDWVNLLPLIAASVSIGLLNVQVITATGTYAKTSGARRALVFATGGGGGGGGHNSGHSGGGGAGGTALAFVDVSGLSTVACGIGDGGAGGVGTPGATGGGTSFGSYAVAAGGLGGAPQGYPSGNSDGSGGEGGAATTGLLLMGGGSGGPGHSNDGGPGGDSFWGGGGRPGNASPQPSGGDGLAPGAAGGGGDGGGHGGNGAKGVIVVIEFA